MKKNDVDFLIGTRLRGGGIVIKHLGSYNKHIMYLCRCNCGETFECSKSRILGNNSHKPRYGCRRCSYKHISDHHNMIDEMIGKRFNRLIVINVHDKIEVTNGGGKYRFYCKCDCGTFTVVDGYQLRKGTIKSCGCLQREIMSARKGPNNPNWNFDLTEEERVKGRLINQPEYNQLKIRCLQKDNYRCKKCNSKQRLEMHHLNGWSWYKAGRFDINNINLLCYRCHKNFHSIFSNRYNTKAQFYEFLVTNY